MAEVKACEDTLVMDETTTEQWSEHGIKICRVCGDRAYSVNFNAVSCESCKAFFRRNALNPKDVRCPFNGQCQINIITRRKCKKCRLEKCFEVGMMKEFIMSDEARKRRRYEREENRVKRFAHIERLEKKTEHANGHKQTHPTAKIDLPVASADTMSRVIESVRPSDDQTQIPKSVLMALLKHYRESSCSGFTATTDYTRLDENGPKSVNNCMCRCHCGAISIPCSLLPITTASSSPRSCCSSGGDNKESEHGRISTMDDGCSMSKMVLAKQDCHWPSSGGHSRVKDRPMTFDFGVSASKFGHFDCLRYAFEVLYDRLDDPFGREQSNPVYQYGINESVALDLPLTAYVERVPVLLVPYQHQHRLLPLEPDQSQWSEAMSY